MKLKNLTFLFFSVFLLAITVFAQSKATPSILPESFAGWERTGKPSTGQDPKAVDAAQANILTEYGFKEFEQAEYKQGDRTLTIKAAKFSDATGAYGAFTFYRQPNMQSEKIGTMSASANERVLFFRDNILVQATFNRVTAMSGSELRELAAVLPSAKGPEANLPSLPQYLPRENVISNTARFIVGPAAYAASGAPLSAQVIDFSRSPEILTAKIRDDKDVSDIVLVAYPTPQIAMEREKAIEGANPNPQATYVTRRTGPIVAVISGAISEGKSKSTLSKVQYEADVTWNENTGLSKRDNIGSIVIAALTLAGIIFLFSLGTGAIFGFGRVILAKLFPSRYKAKEQEAEFIRLKLD